MRYTSLPINLRPLRMQSAHPCLCQSARCPYNTRNHTAEPHTQESPGPRTNTRERINRQHIVETITQFLRTNWLTLIILGVVAAAYLLLQTRATDLASIEDFEDRVRAGHPVIVSMFSNT